MLQLRIAQANKTTTKSLDMCVVGGKWIQVGNKEDIGLISIVAIYGIPVTEPTVDQVSVGDHIEREYEDKRRWMPAWLGILV